MCVRYSPLRPLSISSRGELSGKGAPCTRVLTPSMLRRLVAALLLLGTGGADGLLLAPSAGRMASGAAVRARPPLMVKKPTAEEARAKNPTASDRPEMASKYAGMTANERPTKKNVRSRIMKNGNYKRGGSPFDRDIHSETKEKMSEQFAGELVNQMKQDDFRELTLGEEDRQITFVLAKEFGFCWGVERSIELAWAAREAYPDKTMHITNELIHNPGVNDLLGGMDIQ